MFKLLKKHLGFEWTDVCQIVFENIKQLLTTTPIIEGTNQKEPFYINVDASNYVIGVVLGKKDEGDNMHAIYYISKNLSPPEKIIQKLKKSFLLQYML